MQVLFISSEVADIIKTGGLADVAKALPLSLIKKGHTVKVVMPCYSSIQGVKELPVVATGALNKDSYLEKKFAIRQKILNDSLEIWLIEYDSYYARSSLYGDNNQAYSDNGERFAFLAASALEATKVMDFKPDIVHCNDWHAGLVPMILRIKYAKDEFFDKTRSVLTIHNGAFQGVFDRSQINLIPEIQYIYNDMIYQGQYINFLKSGVFYADKINTVSPGYAKELTTYLGGHGMTRNFQARAADLSGIVNGCDYSDWDPSSDKHLLIRYDIKTLEEKILGKYFLQKRLNLAIGDTPIYGMVARLTDQKGIGILIPILENFLRHKVQIVIQGTGDPKFADELLKIQSRHKDKFVFISAYDESMAHQIEAGSDFFLMPSIFEPCGLNQIYSLAYGTLPIVRSVGGLKDTVIDYDSNKEAGNGFVFNEPSSDDLLSCMRRTLIFYLEDQDEMQRIKRNAMRANFNWDDSSEHYIAMYKDALTKPKWW